MKRGILAMVLLIAFGAVKVQSYESPGESESKFFTAASVPVLAWITSRFTRSNVDNIEKEFTNIGEYIDLISNQLNGEIKQTAIKTKSEALINWKNDQGKFIFKQRTVWNNFLRATKNFVVGVSALFLGFKIFDSFYTAAPKGMQLSLSDIGSTAQPYIQGALATGGMYFLYKTMRTKVIAHLIKDIERSLSTIDYNIKLAEGEKTGQTQPPKLSEKDQALLESYKTMATSLREVLNPKN